MNPETPTTRIRRAGPQDADLLAELGRRTFFEAYAHQNTPEDMAAYLAASFSSEIQSRELAMPGSTFLIAERDGAPAGYLRLLDCPAPEEVRARRPLEVVRIYTVQPFMGQGVGSRLMESAVALALQTGFDALWLSVWTENPQAVRFYQKWGFEIAGTLTFVLGSEIQEDYLMVKALANEVSK